MKRRYYEGGSEEDHDWRIGHPVLFPNILKVGTSFQIRIIVDDTHTLHFLYQTNQFTDVEVPKQEVVPVYDFPFRDEATGEILVEGDASAGHDGLGHPGTDRGPYGRAPRCL